MIRDAAKPLRFDTPAPPAGPIGMASMVDIVLLLICFYLFVAKSVSEADDPTVTLPTIAAEFTEERQAASVVINLRGDGRVTMDGEAVALNDLSGALRVTLDETSRPVVVRADRSRPFGELDRIQRAVRDAGAERVVLRTTEESP